MRLSTRPLALIAVCGVAMLCTACGSNNKGKIVGKWKATALPGMSAEDTEKFKAMGDAMSVVIEFTADGKMIGTITMDMFGKKNSQEIMSANYKLGTGDWVHFTNIKPPPKDKKTESKDKVVINGDTMTLETEKGDKFTLTRIQ
jgi:hypothetical protein